MSMIPTDPSLNNSTTDSPNYVTGSVATPSDTASPAAVAQDSSAPQHGGFLSHIGHVLTDLGGRPAPTYQVDDSGKETAVQAPATPGQLFKNLLMGALTGMASGANAPRGSGFAGGMGAGFVGATQQAQAQDDRARAQAENQFKMKKQAQQAADEHALQQVQLNHWTLDNANLTHTMDFQKKLEPLKLQEAQSALQERQMATVKSAQDMGLTNGRRVDSYDQLNEQDAQDIAKGKKIALTNFDGSATLYDVPSDPFKTQNTKPFEIATWSTGKDGKPVRQVIGTVDTGKGTVANQLAALNSENKSYAEVYGKYIDTQAKKAEISKYYAEIQTYKAALADKTKKADVDAAQTALGQALAATGNDKDKAFELLRQKNPKAYGTLAAIDAERTSSVETSQTDPATGETVKTKTFTGIVPKPQNLTPEQQNATLTRVKQLVAQGQSREQVQAALSQKLGNQTDGVMKWLDSQKAFNPAAASSTSPAGAPTPPANYNNRPFDLK